MQNKPFVLLGINSDSDRDKIKQRLKEEKITWPCWWDKDTSGPIATAWNVRAWPTIYVLDSQGVIRFKGPRGRSLDQAVETLLKEMGVEVVPATGPAEEE